MDIKYIAHSDDLDFEDKVSSLLLYHKIVSITQVDSMEAIDIDTKEDYDFNKKWKINRPTF